MMFDLVNVGVGIFTVCIFILLAIEWREYDTSMKDAHEDLQESYNEYKVEVNQINVEAYEKLEDKLSKGEVDRDKLLLMLAAHSLGVASGVVLYDTEGEEDEL